MTSPAFLPERVDALPNIPCPLSVERRAQRILARLMARRRLLPSFVEGVAARPSEAEMAPHLAIVRAAVAEGRPLDLVLPAFPAKSPNPRKVMGKLPDLAERVALGALQALCADVAAVHPPGVRLVVCSDGLVFADVVGVADEDVAAYGAEMDRLLAPMPQLCRFDLADALGAVPPAALRRCLLDGWAETEAGLLTRVEASPSLRAQLDGMHRFLFEDAVALAPQASRTQVRRRARASALEVLRRSRAWGRLLAACFPRAVRLSIHPQAAVSDKIGVHLVPTADAWLTPWHGVALREGTRFRLVKRADAEALGAVPVDVDGRPSHYVRAS